MKIYVGNLSFDMTEEELRTEFVAFGKVESVSIITDKYSGWPKGFAFVEMPTVSEGQAAITALNGKTLKDGPSPLMQLDLALMTEVALMEAGEAVDLIEEGVEDTKTPSSFEST